MYSACHVHFAPVLYCKFAKLVNSEIVFAMKIENGDCICIDNAILFAMKNGDCICIDKKCSNTKQNQTNDTQKVDWMVSVKFLRNKCGHYSQFLNKSNVHGLT